MKKLIFILALITYSANAQTIFHFGLGVGQAGGTTVIPYESPFLWGITGYTTDVEIEAFMHNNNSFSFLFSYSSYSKSEFSSVSANSNAFYIGTSYNMSNLSNQTKFYYEVSPLIMYGIEEVQWEGDISGISIFTNTDEYIKGVDEMKYVSLGLRGAIGYNLGRFLIKFSLIPKYDFILNKSRSILINNQEGEKRHYLDRPNYQSHLYVQSKISIGIKLF